MINPSSLNNIAVAFEKNDPNDAVNKILRDLHEILAQILKETGEAKLENQQKLKEIAKKIRNAVALLTGSKDGNNLEDAICVLRTIKQDSSDPAVKKEIDKMLIALENISSKAKQMRSQLINPDTSGNGVVV